MGLFDKLVGGQSSQNVTLSPQEAFAGIMLVTVAADGHISDDEAQSFVTISNRMRLFQGQSADNFNVMIDRLQGLLRKHGAQFLLDKATESLPRELKETAFAVIADLIFADGSVEDEEKALLEGIQGALGIPDDLAMQIVQVISIKNRG